MIGVCATGPSVSISARSSDGHRIAWSSRCGNGLFLGVERSATGRAWRDRLDERGTARALAIAQRHDLPELLARILAGRNVDADGGRRPFSIPTVKRLMPDPDVLAACRQRRRASPTRSSAARRVAIFGDYDVDGATSAALLARFLRRAGIEPLIHIPDRIFEGYGPNVEAIRVARRARRDTPGHRRLRHHQHRAADAGSALGLDVVVIDHHQADEELPPAVAIVNPNRLDDLSGLGHLAAVGLVFLTVVAVNRELRRRGFWTAERPEPDLLDFLDLWRSAPSPTWCR